ncbi:hypothetical protein C8R45DRAFT_941912 [Mycena sanguinolenta]|nr:hypothetical protein C8R45DRAFT_941912 [Mycena sanguinolenta]
MRSALFLVIEANCKGGRAMMMVLSRAVTAWLFWERQGQEDKLPSWTTPVPTDRLEGDAGNSGTFRVRTALFEGVQGVPVPGAAFITSDTNATAELSSASENVLALAGLAPGLPRAPGRQNQAWGQKKIAGARIDSGARICISARICVLASFIFMGFLANELEKNIY